MFSHVQKLQLNCFVLTSGLRTAASARLYGVLGGVPVDGRTDAVPPHLVVPVRGMRGAKSIVLHRDVIEQHRLKQQREQAESAGAAQQAPASTESGDMPVAGLENPYCKPAPKCILCDQDIELDYKNTRLLSQFVSPHTGQIYGRAVTGLCLFMQRRVAKLIKRSQFFGFMPYQLKDPRFIRDPKLFDPFKRK